MTIVYFHHWYASTLTRTGLESQKLDGFVDCFKTVTTQDSYIGQNMQENSDQRLTIVCIIFRFSFASHINWSNVFLLHIYYKVSFIVRIYNFFIKVAEVLIRKNVSVIKLPSSGVYKKTLLVKVAIISKLKLLS